MARALVDPDDVPDREGEWLQIENHGDEVVELRDWAIRAGRRRRYLPPVGLDPGTALRLGAGSPHGLTPIRLRNRGGRVVLIDPCGAAVSELAWGTGSCQRARPGWIVTSPRAWPRTCYGPAREIAGGAVGGCGQT